MEHTKDYDLALEAFLEGDSYAAAEAALFAVAAKAFEAGWRAAGGEPLNRPGKEDKYAFLRSLIEHSK